MDPARSVDIEDLRRDIDATRASISRTASALRGKAGDAMQWQTYVERYPVSSLLGAVLLGAAVGRRLAREIESERDAGPWVAAAGREAVTRIPARLEAGGSGPTMASASWERLGGRVEGLVNRIIDDVADALERAVLPALTGAVEAFLGGPGGAPARRPASDRMPAQDAGGRSMA